MPVAEQLQQLAHEVQAGRAAAHRETLRQITRQHPRNALAHYLLGHAAQAAGDAGDAAKAMVKAITLGLDDPAADFHLGRALLAQRDLVAAERAFKTALRKRPDFADARFNLANCAFGLGNAADAFGHYHALHKRGYRAAELPHNLAQAALNAGVWSRGEVIDFLLQTAGDNALAQGLLASLLETEHRLDEAEASAHAALSVDANNTLARLSLARIAMRRRHFARALELTEHMTADDVAALVSSHSLRGQAFEQLDRYAEALAAFSQGKALERQKLISPFDAAALHAELARHRTRFSDPPEMPADTGSAPVFIVGFYRCGSTLLEQMLSMHPAVAACGESDAMAEVEAHAMRTAEGRSPKFAAAWREAYRRALAPDTALTSGRRTVDKQLNNLLRLPLIRWLFPDAQILHVIRHPLDSMLSSFAHQFEDHPPWSTRLIDMATYYQESWTHFETIRATLPPSRYLALRYEELVADPEGVLRQVTEFLGLDWSPALLDYHRSARVARTASYAQVTQPLYQASRFKYRAYLPHLDADFLRTVEPVVHAMGYAI